MLPSWLEGDGAECETSWSLRMLFRRGRWLRLPARSSAGTDWMVSRRSGSGSSACLPARLLATHSCVLEVWPLMLLGAGKC